MLAYEFHQTQSAQPQIWLLTLSSAETQRVSLEGQASHSPAWSPDGRLSYYNQSAAAYEVVLPGANPRARFPNQTGAALTWAADALSFVTAETFPASSDILRGPSGEAGLQTPDPTTQSPIEVLVGALIRYAGDKEESLFDYGGELVEDASPIFSPDGAWLAFTRKYLDAARWTPGRQLWLLEIAGGEARPLTAEPSYLISSLAWSPDGAQLAYLRSNQTAFELPPEIWLINRDGSGARLLAVDAYAPRWLP